MTSEADVGMGIVETVLIQGGLQGEDLVRLGWNRGRLPMAGARERMEWGCPRWLP